MTDHDEQFDRAVEASAPTGGFPHELLQNLRSLYDYGWRDGRTHLRSEQNVGAMAALDGAANFIARQE